MLLLFLVVVPIFGENIISLMHQAKILENYIDEIKVVYNVLKWPLTLFIIYFNIKLIYTIAPSKNIKSKETTYGALFTTIMWIIATAVFKFYLTYFARYDILYGNLSSIIIMLVWCFCLSYIFTLGMAINASQREQIEFLEETKKLALEELNITERELKADA
jgi:membrane protein